MRRLTLAAVLAAVPSLVAAQSYAQLGEATKAYVAVSEGVVALTHVRLVDGTGAAPADDQTVVVENGRIAAVGPAAKVKVPANARVLDLRGSTVLPGIVGLHDHTFYTTSGRSVQSNFTAPRLYLGSGVTTIRTTGSASPYAELGLKRQVDAGQTPGPRMLITGPYLTGGGSSATMAAITTPAEARRVVGYWADEGATWFKFYTMVSRDAMKAAIDEAHRRGLKLTGQLCSVGYREAVALGIDNLEHSLFANSEWDPNKKPDQCPATAMQSLKDADVTSAQVQQTIRDMVDHKVALTTTPSVYELFVPNRPPLEQRTMDAMSGETRAEYMASRERLAQNPDRAIPESLLKKSLAFDRAFVAAGGLLAAGVDPTGNGGALPGFGDQRNYELLLEGGFTPVQAIQIMTLNGAKVLGMDRDVGSVAVGKKADLVVVRGDPVARPAEIRGVTLVFKDGVGYDAPKLVEATKGLVGIR